MMPIKTFIRGQTLEFIMGMPPNVPANYFGNGSTSTTMKCELRKVHNAGLSGLIATLDATWEPGSNFLTIRMRADDTDNWPPGPAELDVLFVRTSSSDPVPVRRFRSLKIPLLIEDGVTRP
jgi:hypothetical protein